MTMWTSGPFLGFDTETTGVNPRQDRIVTAAVVWRESSRTSERTWLINPGVPIPQSASEIHGITTEQAQAEGCQPPGALEEIASLLTEALTAAVPLVAFNAGFDLAILDAELARHGLATMPERLGGPVRPVLDPLVLDRAVDRYRKGKRTLTNLCEVYQVGPAGSSLHTAEVDVAATLDVLEALVRLYPELCKFNLSDLHDFQARAHRRWATSFREYLQRQGSTSPGPDLEWPIGESHRT